MAWRVQTQPSGHCSVLFILYCFIHATTTIEHVCSISAHFRCCWGTSRRAFRDELEVSYRPTTSLQFVQENFAVVSREYAWISSMPEENAAFCRRMVMACEINWLVISWMFLTTAFKMQLSLQILSNEATSYLPIQANVMRLPMCLVLWDCIQPFWKICKKSSAKWWGWL